MVAIGIFGATVVAGVASDLKLVSACFVVVGSGVREPEAGCNTRGGSQRPDTPPFVHVDHAGLCSYIAKGIDSKGLHGLYIKEWSPSLAV